MHFLFFSYNLHWARKDTTEKKKKKSSEWDWEKSYPTNKHIFKKNTLNGQNDEQYFAYNPKGCSTFMTQPSINQEFGKSNLLQLKLNVSPLTIWWRLESNVNFWVPLRFILPKSCVKPSQRTLTIFVKMETIPGFKCGGKKNPWSLIFEKHESVVIYAPFLAMYSTV